MFVYLKLQREWAVKTRYEVNLKENLDQLKSTDFHESKKLTFRKLYFLIIFQALIL